MKRKSGFTLMELMVVIAIIAILAAIAVPNFLSWRTNLRLGASTREILSVIQETRMCAIKDQAFTVIRFDIAKGGYEAFVDDGAGSNPGADGKLVNAGNWKRDGGERMIAAGVLAGGIQIAKASFGPMGPVNRFNLRGMASFIGHVTLADSNGRQYQINVRQSGSAGIKP